MEIYSENLVPDWWDGYFNPVDVKCSLDFKIVASKSVRIPYGRKESLRSL